MPKTVLQTLQTWRSPVLVLTLFAGILAVLVGCQSNNPPVPTTIPTVTRTLKPSPTLAATGPVPSSAPSPTLRPIVQATAPVATTGPGPDAPTTAPTAGPFCTQARQGDTVLGILNRGGYAISSPGLLDEFRRMNNMPPNSNNIVPGQNYCVPKQTPTPSPPGLGATQTKQCVELGCSAQGTPVAIATITVRDGDNIMSLQIKNGVTLRQLCDLNSPSPLNCAGCDIDKPIGQQNCRPVLRLGENLRVPGPTPTPTITPTLTGSETATATPGYSAPTLVSPTNSSSQSGIVQLVWLPVGILQPDEQYLVVLTDATNGKTYEFETQATSYRLPADIRPNDGQPHTINWRVAVARKSTDGAYVVTGKLSLIYTFSWQQ